MRKFSVVMLFFTLFAGAGGLMLRRYELATAFEPVGGLAIRNAEATVWLAVAAILFLVLTVLLAIYVAAGYKPSEDFYSTFSTGSPGYLFTAISVSVVWIFGTVMHLLNLSAENRLVTIDIYFSALSILAAACYIIFAIEMHQKSQHKSSYALSLVPLIFLCFWLILFYRQNAANPVLQSYIYPCLAIIASVMSFYYTTGFLYGKLSPAKATVAYAMTVFLCAVSLADSPGLGISLILVAILVLFAAHLYLLLRNIIYKGGKDDKDG